MERIVIPAQPAGGGEDCGTRGGTGALTRGMYKDPYLPISTPVQRGLIRAGVLLRHVIRLPGGRRVGGGGCCCPSGGRPGGPEPTCRGGVRDRVCGGAHKGRERQGSEWPLPWASAPPLPTHLTVHPPPPSTKMTNSQTASRRPVASSTVSVRTSASAPLPAPLSWMSTRRGLDRPQVGGGRG